MVARIAQEEIRDSETFELIEAQIIECECKAQIQLWDSWANGCDQCGREYNGSGQELAPREFWGEETGETFV